MLQNSFSKPAITIPRLLKNPVDSYNFNQFYAKKYSTTLPLFPAIPIFIHKIRNYITNEVGHDPLIETPDRHAEFVIARQYFLHFIRKYVKTINGKKYTQDQVGALIGKDRCTVSYAEKCVKTHCETEPSYKAMYDRIDAHFK